VESPVVHLIADDYCAPPAPEILAVLDGAAADDDLRIEEGLDRIAELVEQTSSAPRLLAGLDDDQIARLTDGSYLLAFRAGDLLIAEGTVTRTVFGILEGVVEVHRAGRLVAVLTAGDTVGEMAMVLGTERTATVRAATDGRALSISDRAMKRLMDEEPALAAGVLWNLCQVLAHKVSQHRPADG
jgi:CRP-like cAMP-binding protein